MLAETSLLLTVVALLVYLYIQKQWSFLKKWNIPHEPPSLRNLGHAALMLGKSARDFEFQCKRKFGNVWGWYLLTQPRIIIHDPELIQHILVKEFSTFQSRFRKPGDVGSKDLEHGLLAAEGAQWKRMRCTLSPTFSNMKLKAMSKIVNNCISNTMQRLEKMVNENKSTIVDIKDLFNRLSLDVICSVVFSIDVDSQNDSLPEPEISKNAKGFFQGSIVERIRIFLKLSFPFLRKYIGDGDRQIHVSYMRNVVRKLIDAREIGMHHSSRADIMESMLNMRKNADMLSTHEQKGLTDCEITGNAISMLLAGYDTTALAMVYFAYNLAHHCDIQIRLQAEIDEAFEEREVDIETANNLKYLEMCINESLRLYYPVSRTLRTASREITINDLKIPLGVCIDIPVASLSRDPDFWEDPMSYNPERMRNMQSINSIIYQPFGNGPRNCIGMKFAMMEIKLAFCNILRKYTFKASISTPKPPLVLKQIVTTSPAEDINLELTRRK